MIHSILLVIIISILILILAILSAFSSSMSSFSCAHNNASHSTHSAILLLSARPVELHGQHRFRRISSEPVFSYQLSFIALTAAFSALTTKLPHAQVTSSLSALLPTASSSSRVSHCGSRGMNVQQLYKRSHHSCMLDRDSTTHIH